LTAQSPASPQPLPITFVSSHARQGGSERYLLLLLGKLGPDWVREVVALEDGHLVGELRARSYETVVISTSARAVGIARSARRLRRELVLEQPALVHANGVKAALVAVLAAWRTGIPVVWVKHDFSKDGRLARWIGARCARVVGVAPEVLHTFVGTSIEPRTRVVYNGVDPRPVDRSSGRRLLEEALGSSPGSPLVLLVGRFDPAKGHGELLAVTPALAEAFPALRVVFVGAEDPSHVGYAETLRQEASRLGVSAHLHMLGYWEDALDLISGADALVIPSTAAHSHSKEAFPLVSLDALVAGTPVVAYADGGLPGQLGDCALLVPPGDRGALSAAIVRVLRDERLKSELSRCGQERVTRLFSLGRMVAEMEEVYAEVASSS
jgi:glycosyltransferase involved in cell wall biosynthesis